MPAAVQLTGALLACVCAGVMGMALVPFLERMRMYGPEEAGQKKTGQAGERVRPVMGGLLAVGGTIAGLAAGYALYCRLTGADRTSQAFQTASWNLLMCFLLGMTGALGGWLLDLWDVRRFVRSGSLRLWEPLLLFLVSLGYQMLVRDASTALTVGHLTLEAGAAARPLRALLMALLWMGAARMEDGTDGVCVSTSCVQMLCMAVLFLRSRSLYALVMLAGAGGCMGCMIWNLPPAKCRLGRTGYYWLGGLLAGSVVLHADLRPALLLGAVYAVGALPLVRPGQPMMLMSAMERSGLGPWKRIGLAAGFAAFCGILMLLP